MRSFRQHLVRLRDRNPAAEAFRIDDADVVHPDLEGHPGAVPEHMATQAPEGEASAPTFERHEDQVLEDSRSASAVPDLEDVDIALGEANHAVREPLPRRERAALAIASRLAATFGGAVDCEAEGSRIVPILDLRAEIAS